MFPQAVLHLADVCADAGIENVIISPGSRSAPLVLAFARSGKFNIQSALDERSGGFIALGMALASEKPSILICTSGTAVLNYGPAIAEAYYQQVPLLVLTADRPAESIDQWDGQAIRQQGVFASHCRFHAQVPSTDFSPEAERHAISLFQQAIFQLQAYPPGPVHLNLPFREPFYPNESEELRFPNSKAIRIVPGNITLDSIQMNAYAERFSQSENRMLLVGQQSYFHNFNNSLKALTAYGHIVVVGDVLNNITPDVLQVSGWDWFSPEILSEEAKIDILISTGTTLLSKKLKNFLRKNKPKQHWHICLNGFPPDPLKTITDIIHCDPSWFLSRLAETVYFQQPETQQAAEAFQNHWNRVQEKYAEALGSVVSRQPWGDFWAIHTCFSHLPDYVHIFAGNSMAIRYVNALSHCIPTSRICFGNRGTSGIDGCLSTAVGIALAAPEKPMIAILGDISFFYDRNALWRNNIPKNLKIMILNNNGGNIFRIIPDSGKLPEMESWFEMDHILNAEKVAKDAQMGYFSIHEKENASQIFSAFFSFHGPAILECKTNKVINHQVYQQVQSFCHAL